MTDDVTPWANRIVGYGTKPASQFTAHPHNWRKHPQRQRSAVRGSLDSLGWVDVVIENKTTGRVVDGHERIWNALKNGDADVPFIEVELSEAEEAQALLSLDAIAALAETDRDNVAALLEQVQTDNADVMRFLSDFAAENKLDWGQAEPGDAEPQIDRAAELLEKWGVKSGDLWRIGDHRLLCGDSTKREDVERVMGGEKAGAVVTDPPYGVLDEEWDRYPEQKDLDLWASVTDGALMAFGAAPTHCINALLKIEPLAERIYIWWNTFTLTHSEGAFWQWQPIYTWRRSNVVGLEKDVIDMAANTGGDKLVHVTQKPTKLIEMLLSACADAKSFYDPFVGSGTTLVACQNLGRKCRAIEISPAYCAVTLERMAQAFPGIEIARVEP